MVRNYKRKTVERWNKQDLLDAICSIKNNTLKTQDAAKRFGISRATLYRQFKRYMVGGCHADIILSKKPGGHSILTETEEDVLEKTLGDLVNQGHTISARDVKRICFEYCDSNDIPNKFNKTERLASSDWYYGYIKRRPGVVKLIKIKRDSRSHEEKDDKANTKSKFGRGFRKKGRLASKVKKRRQNNCKSNRKAAKVRRSED